MRFEQCVKCLLILPITRLIPIILTRNHREIKTFICERCKEGIDKQKEKKV